ncbi:MAG: hypothetical protein K9M75_01280 [Phycisphaerae bacterium]|nr:hypothetical protein [Phycisphaerae bacterium]
MRVVRIQEFLQGMIGNVCWGIEYAPTLSLNFGEPRLDFKGSSEITKDRKFRSLTTIRPEYFFWLRHSHWNLSVKNMTGESIVNARTSSSSKQKMEVCRFLNGQKLTSVHVDNETAKTILRFDLDAELTIRHRSSTKEEMWHVSGPNDRVIQIFSDGTFEYSYYINESWETFSVMLQSELDIS